MTANRLNRIECRSRDDVVSQAGAQDNDLLRVYLSQIGQYRLLSRDEEWQLSRRIQRASRCFRRTVLSCDYAIKAVVDLLQAVVNGELRRDRVLQFSFIQDHKREELGRRLRPNLATLRQMAEQNALDYGQSRNSRFPVDERQAIKRRLLARRRRAVRLIEELGLRMEYVLQIHRDIAAMAKGMNGRRSIGAVGSESIRTKSSRVRRACWEAPASLRRRVARADAYLKQRTQERQLLTSANLRLVITVAKRYRCQGIPLLDLIQEGNGGLMHAVDRFDGRRGYRFATFAIWWIRQAISRAVGDQSRFIRLPAHMHEKLSKLHKARRKLAHMGEIEQSGAEVAAEMRISPEMVDYLGNVDRMPLSLDQPVSGKNELIGEFLVDHNVRTPNEKMDQEILQSRLAEALGILDYREREILRLRFGLADGCDRTLGEVSAKFSITRERVRQLEAEALQRLRCPMASKRLAEFV